ncbi:MAG: hypothetical protein IKO20_09290 [Bacteroidaceae bacterium]|nr:hypothetical protein [Bacteroidaceae bacterium]
MSNLELNCKWHFAKQLGGREDGPNDPMQDNFKKNPYASLIRESIQNSLDVPLDSNQPVRMEFSISRIRANEYANFFELKKHIQGCLKHFPNNDDAKVTYKPMLDYLNSLNLHDNLYYIKVSDYNAIGMNYIKGDTSCPFYAFVRAAGVSAKNDATAGGSFGYGKAAYFYISPLRTIFVSTKTKDGRNFFEGVSSLCTHEMEGDKELRVSVGYYDNNDGEPVTNPQNIPARFQRNESGTDIYIIGIDASDKQSIYSEMIEAVLRNFWLAIENNKLEVKISEIEINAEKLPELMEQFFPEELDTTRREKSYNPRPYWEAVHLAGSDKYHIVFEDKLPTVGRVRFFAMKNKKATDKVLYMRRPLMLVKARRTQSSNGFFGVFVCEDRYGNEILRKTENPAHDEWSSSNWRENGKIVPKGRDAIAEIDDFIIKVMEQMFSNRGSSVQQIQGLEEFLYIPTAVDDDEDFETESLVGDIIGQQEEEGSSISTDVSNPVQTPIIDNPAIGKVMITDPVEEKQKRNSEGGHLSGHGKRKKIIHGGGGLSPKRIEGHFGSAEEGIQGTMLTEIPVRYRSFAQIENGRTVHNIIIHSDYDILNGRIDLIIGGEQSDDIVAIKKCSLGGKIEANSISGLHIQKGKNVLNIEFADNMKHAVKLDAYELK